MEEKRQSNQLDKYVEETIYNGGFPNAKDNINIEKFRQTESWNEKLKLKDIFEDQRYSYLANRLIFENNPEILSESDYKKYTDISQKIFSLLKKNPLQLYLVLLKRSMI